MGLSQAIKMQIYCSGMGNNPWALREEREGTECKVKRKCLRLKNQKIATGVLFRDEVIVPKSPDQSPGRGESGCKVWRCGGVETMGKREVCFCFS